MSPRKIIILLVLLGLPTFVWSDIKVYFTPSVAATYTSNSNVFTEVKDVQTATSYELIPSARLSAVFGKNFRTSLLYRYSSSQYLTPSKGDLEDKAEDRGLERESVVEFRNSGASLSAEYGISPQLSTDINVRYDNSGLPTYESSYFNHLGVSPGFWYNPTKTTSMHFTYIYNSYDYPLKNIPEDEIPQRDLESGGAILLVQKMFSQTKLGLTFQNTINDSNDDLWDYESANEFINLWQNFGKNVSLQVTGHLRQRLYRTLEVTEENTNRLDYFTGFYNYLSVYINPLLSFNFGYDALLNSSNAKESEYNKSFVYGGITLSLGAFKASF